MKRFVEFSRKTNETDINLKLTVYNGSQSAEKGSEKSKENRGLTGSTKIGFFDHMLNSFCVHGNFRIELDMTGDLWVDCHHSIEDVGIVLGSAFRKIIDENKNIARFASEYTPMDESLVLAVIDISNRPYLAFDADFTSDKAGDYDTQMTKEFFYALAVNMGATLHLKLLYGTNDHHKIEALFKATARVIGAAMKIEYDNVLSSKGML